MWTTTTLQQLWPSHLLRPFTTCGHDLSPIFPQEEETCFWRPNANGQRPRLPLLISTYVLFATSPKCGRHGIVGRCDLRNYRSRSSSRILKEIHGSACLMLLNPPFSCRGGTKYSVHLQGACIFASTAMSFLLTATKYVADNGHIASILPLGSLSSTKDQEAWEYLRRKYHVELVATYPKGTFPNSAATTALVRLSPLVGTRQSTAFTHHLPPSHRFSASA